jgi:hypothetical protein
MARVDEWIKMRKKLRKDGRVLQVARSCNVIRVTVLGALLDMWFFADEYADENGVVVGWSAADLDAEVGVVGFAESLPLEWLMITPEGLQFPRYLEHNGTTAKNRADSDARVKKYRDSQKEAGAGCNVESVTSSPSLSKSNKNNGHASPKLSSDERKRLLADYPASVVSHYEQLAAAVTAETGKQTQSFAGRVRKFILNDQAEQRGMFKPPPESRFQKPEVDRSRAADRKIFKADRNAKPAPVAAMVKNLVEAK